MKTLVYHVFYHGHIDHWPWNRLHI